LIFSEKKIIDFTDKLIKIDHFPNFASPSPSSGSWSARTPSFADPLALLVVRPV
jgi:hypothetical protein